MQLGSTGRVLQTFIMTVALIFAGVAMAEPSRQDIDQALRAGDIAKASVLMKEVLTAHPESAKAHFKYSEILAAEGRVGEARTELTKAEKIEPGLAFVKPEAVDSLKRKLSNGQNISHKTGSSPIMLWIGLAIAGAIAFIIFRSFRRPQIQPAYPGNPQQMPNGYGPQGGFPPQGGYGPQGGGMGSGIMGGLATGAAVGAGIVAGEVLMHKVLDGDHSPSNDAYSNQHQPTSENYNDISGNEFVDNDNGSWDNDSLSDSSSFDSDSSGDWS